MHFKNIFSEYKYIVENSTNLQIEESKIEIETGVSATEKVQGVYYDERFYAAKKYTFDDTVEEERILKCIQQCASLSHKNIVRFIAQTKVCENHVHVLMEFRIDDTLKSRNVRYC